MRRLASLLLLALVAATRLCAQAELTKIENLRLVEGGYGDGDSFHVTDGATNYHFRLYLVDTPETEAADPSLARRVREQTRYFGLPGPADTLRLGKTAAERTRVLLAKPFTAYTAGTRGLGRSAEPRVYAYIVTADGQDLGTTLVTEGLARSFGVGRIGPTGVSQDEQRARLADLEFAAALARRGIWAESDPDKLAAARAAEREDEAELAAVSAAARPAPVASENAPLDLNTATLAQLDGLPGIGPTLAQRIIDARPFATVDDLRKVSGIGATAFAKLQPLVSVGAAGLSRE